MISTKLCQELYAGSFSLSTKIVMYPSMQKTSSTGRFLQPSSLPDLLEKSISIALVSSSLTAQHLAVWFYIALQWNCCQWTPVTKWRGKKIGRKMILFSVCILYSSLSLQHLHHWETFAKTVSPPLRMLSSSSWSYSHLTLTYTVSMKICSLRVSLQTASGDVPAPGFLFYPSVLSYRSGPKFKTCTFVSTVYLTFQPRGWSYFHIFHLSPLGAVLVKGAFFFLLKNARKPGGSIHLFPRIVLPLLLRMSRKFFPYLIILNLLGLNFYVWFFIIVFMMVLTTCYKCLCLYLLLSKLFGWKESRGTSPVPILLLA